MPNYGSDPWDRCGYGTPWGCGGLVHGEPAFAIRKGRPAETHQHRYDDGHVLFHRACSAGVPSHPGGFSAGFRRELAARSASALPAPTSMSTSAADASGPTPRDAVGAGSGGAA